MATIRLTPAQRSALECAGLSLAGDDEPNLLALDAAWDGANTIDVTPDTFAAVLAGLTDRANAEDDLANNQGDGRARGACTALTNLAAKIIRLRRPDRIETETDR